MRPDTSSTAAVHNPYHEESIAHLSVVLAHRLRGLVAGIEGFADLLNDTLMDADQRALAMKIMEGAARIESVLADLQLYGESLDPVMLPVRVDEVVKDLFVPLEAARGEEIATRIDDDAAACMLCGDPFLLRQVLLLLLQNALEADRGRATVRLDVLAKPADVRFDVWNGGTIDVENAPEAVFTPFFTTKAHNLGVGLSIARRIARLHGASVALTCNDADRGTCFTLTLPRDDASRGARQA